MLENESVLDEDDFPTGLMLVIFIDVTGEQSFGEYICGAVPSEHDRVSIVTPDGYVFGKVSHVKWWFYPYMRTQVEVFLEEITIVPLQDNDAKYFANQK